MGRFDRNCEWYCDNCDAHLNNQSGFTAAFGSWKCSECGYVNDVTEDNILTGDEEEFQRKCLAFFLRLGIMKKKPEEESP